MSSKKDLTQAIIYFALSTLITWWFVDSSNLYKDENQKLLSTAIAGGKWTLQIGAALLLLQEKRLRFIRNIGFTCFAGSLILLPYCFFGNTQRFFVGSLLFSVLAMIVHYRISVKNAAVSFNWYYGWLACLAIAISLQLTIVFHVL